MVDYTGLRRPRGGRCSARRPGSRSPGSAGAVVVLTLCLYPTPTRSPAPRWPSRPGRLRGGSRVGAGHTRAGLRVVVPMTRLALAAGVALEGWRPSPTSPPCSTRIRPSRSASTRCGKGTFDRQAAAGLATVVLVFALLVLAAERRLRGRALFDWQPAALGGPRPALHVSRGGPRQPLRRAAVVLPPRSGSGAAAGRVALADGGRGSGGAAPVRRAPGNGLLLAVLTAAGCTAVALVVVHGWRMAPGLLVRCAAPLTTVGYVPGVVLDRGAGGDRRPDDAPLEALGARRHRAARHRLGR
ncbi:hypothetical protein HBB16_16150 [Pseudonocardia sp. MCCB 268]|nr:hypothetical protein [Pseudonocardia cytotoxica]